MLKLIVQRTIEGRRGSGSNKTEWLQNIKQGKEMETIDLEIRMNENKRNFRGKEEERKTGG